MERSLHGTACVPFVVAALALLAISCGGTSDEVVDAYCAYGAKSQAQWDGCTSHVSADEVRASTSRAAACAVDGGKACEQPGPFRQTWLELRDFCSDREFADPEICTGRFAEYRSR